MQTIDHTFDMGDKKTVTTWVAQPFRKSVLQRFAWGSLVCGDRVGEPKSREQASPLLDLCFPNAIQALRVV